MGVLIIILLILFLWKRRGGAHRPSSYEKDLRRAASKDPKAKGAYGEYLILKELEELRGHKRILTNVYLPRSQGDTTEIDLILLCEKGIYVIESKNYSGMIIGDERDTYWIQHLNQRSQYKFYSPVKQNEGHIRSLNAFLSIPKRDIYRSCIVFSDRCQLKKVVMRSDVMVVHRCQLYMTLVEDLRRRPAILSAAEIEYYYKKLEPCTHVSEAEKAKHAARIYG